MPNRTALSLSGGKDSTAVLLRLYELGMPPDRVVMFDEGAWSWPELVGSVKLLEKHLKITVHRVYPRRGGEETTLDALFDTWRKTKGSAVGDIGYGWACSSRRWCTRCKCDALDKWHRNNATDVNYIGIAADELHRTKNIPPPRHNGINEYPLVEWGWSEADALEYCLNRGYNWGNLYDHFARVSCWCCPLQSVGDLRKLYQFYPEMWARLEDMQRRIDLVDGDSRFKGNRSGYGESVFEWTRRFEEEGTKDGID